MNLPAPQRQLAFSALILATVLAVLDISAVNLALPTIATDLGLTIEQALWLSKANLLACAITILPCAALGDLMGHRRLLTAGLLIFAMTSTGTALSSELWVLVTLRTIQGCAGAAIMCSTLVLIREIFPVKMLGAALGINALSVAVATTTGPALSGVILSFLTWRWVFAISPPLAVFALIIGRLYLPEKRVEAHPFDLVGTGLLVSCAAMSLVSFLCPAAAWMGGLAALWAILFLIHQRQVRWPLLPLEIFCDLRFDYALAVSVAAFIAQSSVYILLPLVFQQAMGFSPLAAAGLMIPWPLMTAIAGPWAGRCADRKEPRAIACAGLALLAMGLASLAALPAEAQPLDIIWRTAVCGIGFGLFQSPNNREILTNVLPKHAARGAALLCTARLLGQSLGAIFVGLAHAPTGNTVLEMLWSNAALLILLCAIGAWVSSLDWHHRRSA